MSELSRIAGEMSLEFRKQSVSEFASRIIPHSREMKLAENESRYIGTKLEALVVVRLKFYKRSVMKFVSRTIQ